MVLRSNTHNLRCLCNCRVFTAQQQLDFKYSTDQLSFLYVCRDSGGWLVVRLSPRRPEFAPRPIHFRFVVEKVTLRQGFFSRSTCVFPCQYHSNNAQYSSLCSFCSCQDKRARHGNVSKRNILPEIGDHWIEKYLHLKNKNQLDATYYFIVFLIGSTCFGHYYAHHQELATIMSIPTLVVSFLVCCRLEVRCG